MISSVCVFCGARSGVDANYAVVARSVGTAIARAGLRLVYGGGRIGLMGEVAAGAREGGAEVAGIMPRSLAERELGDNRDGGLEIVESMHERKLRMADRADAFIALPGGAGTLEEIFEQWTWAQLGIHRKPCGFLNVAGYYDPLLAMIEKMRDQGFLAPEYAEMLIIADDIDVMLERIRAYQPPAQRWSVDAAK